MSRLAGFGALIVLSSLLLLWLPVAGALLFAVAAVTVPPWGRTFIERAVISLVVIIGAAALVFPRAGSTPIDGTSVRVFLIALMFAMFAVNLVPQLRATAFPRLRLMDLLILGLVVVLWFVLTSPFLSGTDAEVISGLYFAGWDNHAHYTTFANTYVSESTTWPTADGAIAWNQWYPSLHTTLWALGTFLTSGADLDRMGLLIPYVQWSAASFAVSMGVLAWIASDVAGRWGTRTARRTGATASAIALSVVVVWVFLGTPQYLFNAGFTNFTMGVSLVAAANYAAVRSPRSARTLGWFIVPLAAVAVVGLWTPLVLGLVPAGVIVAVSLLRSRIVLAVVWLVTSAAVALVVTIRQLGDVLSAGGEADAAQFATDIGGVAVGMVPFNLTAAIAAPVIAVAIALLVASPWTVRWGLAGPSLMTAVVAVTFVPGAVAAGVWWLDSYYVQKALNATLLMTVPLIAAAAGVFLASAFRRAQLREAVAGAIVVALLGVAAFSSAGIRDTSWLSGVPNFPGLEAVDQRNQGPQSVWLGELILAGVDVTEDLPEYAPVLWEGPGTLANLWTGSLHGTLSSAQQVFYLSLPQPPAGDDAAAWAKEALVAFPELRIAFVPPSVESGEFLRLRFGSADPRRAVVVTD